MALVIGLVTLPMLFASRSPKAMPINVVVGVILYTFFLIYVEPRIPG
jgi:RsiW-degrading membrane proteinase PrsW (M82 family)